MKYNCHDIFMVRVPALPTHHTLNYLEAKTSAQAYLSNNHLDAFFREALLISSRSLYTSYRKADKGEKEQTGADKGISKYLIRAASRPTPFGIWGSVGLARWGKQDSIVLDANRRRKKAQVDDQWISHIIADLEKQADILCNLELKMNPIVYAHGNRVKNPFYSNHGLINKNTTESFLNNSIKNSPLIALLSVAAADFVPYGHLLAEIEKQYKGIPRKTVEDTIANLVDNEFLLTNLRIPPFCTDSLKHVQSVLSGMETPPRLATKLSQIGALLTQYEESASGELILEEIYQEMQALYQTDHYLKVDAGIVFQNNNNTLSYEIKRKLEHFAEKLSYLAPDPTEQSYLKKFKEAFAEKYGTNVDVPLKEVIDENQFDGLGKLSSRFEGKESQREAQIKAVFDNRILAAYGASSQEVSLTIDDFAHINLTDKLPDDATSFDLNVFICKDAEGYQLKLGPNVGATGAGKMFQRFSEVFEPEDYRQYNNLYGHVIEKTKSQYCIAEIREAHTSGRITNVVGNNKTYRYHIALGNSEKACEQEIQLHQLVIGMAADHRLYIKLVDTDTMVKVTTNHMLNVKLGSKLQQLLVAISEEYETMPVHRILCLYQNSYPYIPRIVYEGVVIYPRMWNIVRDYFDTSTFEAFLKDFSQFRTLYTMDDIVYLAEGDNRLIIDVRQEEWQQYLYHLVQKDKSINLRELEDKTFQNSLVVNAQNEQYTAEFVFSFVRADPKAASAHKKKSYLIQNTRQRYALADDGWVYLKLYGVNSRENEFLTKYLDPALQDLCAQTFFFLRYEDSARHLRLRLQFGNTEEAIERLKVLHSYLMLWKEGGLLEHVVFDTYEPEVNRYGGQELVKETHNVFHCDSLWVMALLSQFSMDNTEEKEKAYFVGMVSAFLALTSSEEELFAILDEENLRNAGQDAFKKQRRKYLDWFESLKEDVPQQIDSRFAAIKQPFFQRQQAYKAFGEKMKCFDEIELTNTKNEIIYSLIHMFCNRTTGVLSYESHCLSLIRHTVYNYMQKQKHVCKQAALSDKQ